MRNPTRGIRLAAGTLFASVGLCLSATAMAAGSPAAFAAKNGWYMIADGVYEHQDADGSTHRVFYGQGGADFERQQLLSQIAELQSGGAGEVQSDDVQQTIADLQRTLATVPEKAGPGVAPADSTSGLICGWRYFFDGQLIVGQAGATAVARSVLGPNPGGPVIGTPTSVTQHTSATVTPTSGGAVTDSNSSTAYTKPSVSIASWAPAATGFAVGSGSCTGSATSNVTVNDSHCTGNPAFAGQTITFTTCVTTP